MPKEALETLWPSTVSMVRPGTIKEPYETSLPLFLIVITICAVRA